MKTNLHTPARTETASWNPDARKGLIVVCTAAFLVPFMGSSLNLALPKISDAFSMKAVTLTWMATVYLISTAVFQIPFARVADLIGRKKIFLLGLFVFSFGCGLCGLATSEGMLIAFRFISGIGSSMMFGTNVAIITSLFPVKSRGKALGINTAVVYAAMAAGPFLGGILTQYLGWQSIFFTSSGVGILVFIFSFFILKNEWVEARGEKFDIEGSVLYGVGVASVIYGFSSLAHIQGIIFLIIGIGILVAFIFFEKQHASPVFNVRLFSGNRVFTLSSLAALINYAATAAIAFMLSLYLQYVRGLEASQAGLILIVQACVQSFFSLVAGNLSVRYSSDKLATTGMSIIVIVLSGLIFLSQTTPYWMLICLLMLLGVGFGIFSSPNTNVIMGSVDKKYYTQASASTGTMRLTGQAFSMGIAGMAISFYVGNNKITPELHTDFMHSMQMTFIIFVALCLVGVYASTARITKKG
jgi:EmrB/QacA subfamily drug resistance transporter